MTEGKKVHAEESAPDGWDADEIKFATLSQDKTVTLTFTDTFVGDPIKLSIEKQDIDNSETKLDGAQFTLTDNQTQAKLVFETKEGGKINFWDPQYLVSGKVYIADGKIQYYAGTYTLQETKAPTGYKISGEYSIKNTNIQDVKFTSNQKWKIEVTSNKGEGRAYIKETRSKNIGISQTAGKTLTIKETGTEPEWFKFKIDKTDGDEVVYYYSIRNGNATAKKAKKVSLEHMQATNSKHYGDLSTAEFSLTVINPTDSSTKASKVKTIFTRPDASKDEDGNYKYKVAEADRTKLKTDTWYYCPVWSNFKKYIEEGKMKAQVVETEAPTGWSKGTSKTAILEKNKAVTIEATDSFSGISPNMVLKKTGVDGKGLAGVQFKLIDTDSDVNGNHRTWIFETDSNGEIHFDKLDDIFKGEATIKSSTDKSVQYFAGHYVLYEVEASPGYYNKGTYAVKNGSTTIVNSTEFGSSTVGATDQEILEFDITSTNGVAKLTIGDKTFTEAELNQTAISIPVDETPIVYQFSATKTDGGQNVYRALYANGTAETVKTITHSNVASAFTGYGKLTEAKYSITVSGNKKKRTVQNIYTDVNCKDKVDDPTKLTPGTTYFIPKNNLNPYATTNGVSATLNETVTPDGWKTGSTNITLKLNQPATGTIVDTFDGMSSWITIKKLGETTGDLLSDAQFTLTDGTRTWVYKSINGKIDFTDPQYLVSGWAYYTDSSKKKLQFFGGTYELTESKPPAGYLASGKYKIGSGTEKDFAKGYKWVITVTPKDDGSGKAQITNLDKMTVSLTAGEEIQIKETETPYPFQIVKTMSEDTVKTITAEGETGTVNKSEIAKTLSSYGTIDTARFKIEKDSKNNTTSQLVVYKTKECKETVNTSDLKAGETYWVKCAAVGVDFKVTETTAPKGWTGQGDVQYLHFNINNSNDPVKANFTDTFYGTPFNSVLNKQGEDGRQLKGAIFKLYFIKG